jgi:hypothetical protein
MSFPKCFYFGAKNSMFHMTNSWNAVYCTQNNSKGIHFVEIMLGMIIYLIKVRNDYDYLYYWNKRYYNQIIILIS